MATLMDQLMELQRQRSQARPGSRVPALGNTQYGSLGISGPSGQGSAPAYSATPYGTLAPTPQMPMMRFSDDVRSDEPARPMVAQQAPAPAPAAPAQQFGPVNMNVIKGLNQYAQMGDPQAYANQFAGGDLSKVKARTYRNEDGTTWNDYYVSGLLGG